MKLFYSLFALAWTATLLAYEPTQTESWAPQNCYENCCEEPSYKIGFEWLFWKAEQERLSCGVQVITQEEREATYVNGKYLQPHFKYKNGYRVSLTKKIACSDWDIRGVYGYVPGSGNFKGGYGESKEFVSFTNFNFLPLFFLQESQFSNAYGNWNLKYHYLDIDLGRQFCCTPCFSVRPHAGFRILWLRETYTVGGKIYGYKEEVNSGAHISMKQHMKAFGLEGGVYGNWDIGCNCSLIGHVGGAILYSKYSTDTKIDVSDYSNENNYTYLKADSSSRFGTLMADYSIGFQWVGCVCSMPLTARVSWEQQVILDTNRWSEGGNLSLQGITLGLEASF